MAALTKSHWRPNISRIIFGVVRSPWSRLAAWHSPRNALTVMPFTAAEVSVQKSTSSGFHSPCLAKEKKTASSFFSVLTDAGITETSLSQQTTRCHG